MASDAQGTPAASSTWPVAYGLDFSWGRPPVETMLANGYTFVCRYLSWDTTGKNLSADEAAGYLAAGIAICSNWEYAAAAPRNGWQQGVDDAIEAAAQHTECGGPPDAAIYFSTDFDAQPDEMGQVLAYYQGVASVIGVARTGAYAGFYVIRDLFDYGAITWGWQTYAWSNGQWDSRAQLRQVQNGISVGGHDCDLNEAWYTDYGAWGQASGLAPTARPGGSVLLKHPTDPERVDLFWVDSRYAVQHRWCRDMTDLWLGNGQTEDLGGQVVPGTLTAVWATDGSGVDIAGLGAPDEETCPSGCGQYWGYQLNADGGRSGWGSFAGIFGRYPWPPAGPARSRHHRPQKG